MDSKIKKLRENLGKMSSMKHKYGLTASSIENYIKDTEHFQVVTPLIGEFSTGKSSLINTLLNRKLLGEGIEPKTAVPTEICYGSQEQAIIYAKDGNTKTLSLDDFQNMELSVEEVKKVQLHIDAPFLNEIDSVKIVDMPGYNSGIELHNRAIDDYLPNSQAYILTFQARTPTIQEDMANFLKELKLHEVPVYLMIKAKSVLEQELKDCVEHIKADAQKYLGLSDVNIGVTNAKGKDKDIAFFEESLRDIAKQSKEIFAKDMELHLAKEGKDLAIYLQTSLKQTDLTPSELEAEIDSAQHNLKSLQDKLENLKNEFNRQLDTCVSNIKGSLASSLDGVAPELENMLVNGLDIRDKLNMVLRETVINAIHDYFDPMYKRYLEKVSDTIQVNLAFDSSLKLDEFQIQTDSILKEAIKKSIPLILAAIGLIVTSNPIGALVAAVIGIAVELGFIKKQQNDKRSLAHQKIYGELIPQVTNKATEKVRTTLLSQVDTINEEIGKTVQQQVEAQEKALEDIKKRYSEEQEQKNQSIQDMQADLAVVQEMVAQ